MKKISIITIFINLFIFTNIQTQGNSKKMIVTSKNGLILRSSKNIQSKKIVNIPYLQQIYVIEKTNVFETIDNIKAEWCKVQWLDYEGYVFSGYLEPINTEYFENFRKNINILIPTTINSQYLNLFKINSPIHIQEGQLATFVFFEGKKTKLLNVSINNSNYIRDEDYGDALFGNGFKINKDNTWSRYEVNFNNNIIEKYLIDQKIGNRNIETLILYPPIDQLKCLHKKDVTSIPKGESLINLAYALDLNQDNDPDILMFISVSYYQGYIKKNNQWNSEYSLISKFAEPHLAFEYLCSDK